jgi:hypothetical protein
MNTQNNNLLAKISKEETKKLTQIVNETIALGIQSTKTFTNVDFWNIQRQRKSTLQRRHYA